MVAVGLVTTDGTTTNAQDNSLEDDLLANSHTVTLLASTSDLPNTGHDVLVITESGSSGSAAITSIPGCALPVMLMETTAQTMLISSSAATSPASTATMDITTAGNSHELTSGLADPFTARSSSGTFYGVATADVASGAEVLAVNANATTSANLVVAETGAALTSGVALNRRMFMGPGVGGSSVSAWTTGMFTLFRDAVVWLAAGEGLTSTGEVYATGEQTVSEAPWSDNSWVNGTNLTGAPNSTYADITAASYDTGAQSWVAKVFGYDFSSIPSGSTIDGVIVRVKGCSDQAGQGAIDLMQLLNVNRAKVGDNKGSVAITTTATDQTFTFGAANDKWGNALDLAWVQDADFGVAFGMQAVAANTDVRADAISIEVFYTAPAAPTPLPRSIQLPYREAVQRASRW